MKCIHVLGLAACVSHTSRNNQISDDRSNVQAVQGMREENSWHKQQSLAQLETSQGSGTYQFKGIPRDPAKNFCRAVVSNLQSGAGATNQFGHKTAITSGNCASDGGADQTACEQKYVKHAEGRGKFTACKWNAASGECEQGYEHHCTWTYLMEDLIDKQKNHIGACHGHMLEAKRSLDGLLYDAESILRRIRIQNERIYAQNITIRDLLQEQKTKWSNYMQEQDTCWDNANASETLLLAYDAELQQLEALITIVRSGVDFHRDSKYGEHSDASQGLELKRLVETGAPTPAPDQVWDAGDQSASLLEMEERALAACAQLQEIAKKHGVNPFEGMDCNQERGELQKQVNQLTKEIRDDKNSHRQDIADTYTECLSEATYEYKFAIESRDCNNGPCIDRKIQLAALEIHDAQNTIATWEPRLHDVEHAAERVRVYLGQLNGTCKLDDTIEGELYKVQKAIRELAECPGRNDFTLVLPHGPPPTPPPETPSPTPWYKRFSDPDDERHVPFATQYGNQDLDAQLTNPPTRSAEHQKELSVTTV